MKNKTLSIMSAIFTIGSIAGVFATAGLTAYISPKAKVKLDEKKEAQSEPLTKMDIVKEVGPMCAPCVIAGAVTIGCIVGSNISSKKQLASMSAVLAVSTKYVQKYKEKIKELYGEVFEKDLSEKIEREVREEVKDDIHLEKAAKKYFEHCTMWNTGTNQSVDDPGTKMLFYDLSSGMFFEKTLEQVLLAEYHLNRHYVMNGEVTMNDWYDNLGLTELMSEINENLIWSPLDIEDIWIDFNHHLKETQDGRKYYEIEIVSEPYHLDEIQ